MKSYEDFKKAIRMRESSDNYHCENSFGYLGAYQFGMARLCDLRVTQRVDPHSKAMGNTAFIFALPFSKARFLEDKELQDRCFDMHVQKLKKEILRRCGNTVDLSGAIAACHLLGMGGLDELLSNGTDRCDALGTTCSSYLKEFSGYSIP